MAMDEDRLRSGLTAAASRVTACPDLFDRVAAARARRVRTRTVVAAVTASLATVAIATAAIIGLQAPPAPSAAPAISTAPLGPGSRSGATGPSASCPSSDDEHPGFNSWKGPQLVDPHSTQVRICHYSPDSSGQSPWKLDGSAMLAGTRAATLVQELNAAPAADLHRRCMSAGHEEVWFFMTGTTTTAEVHVQLGGCGFASDGRHTVTWRHPGAFGNGTTTG
jgi:hypothetical protein